MGRSPCCSKQGLNRGAWTQKEDMILSEYIRIHGDGKWKYLAENAGLKRCGKSCRLRWVNYLRPDIKHGNVSPYEDELIIRLHRLLGNRWSLIAGRLPGRTENEIKNNWNCRLSKKLLPMNQSQSKSSQHNLNRGSKDRSPRQNYVHRAIPVKITTAVAQSELVKANSGKSSCDLLVNTDSEDMAFCTPDVNLVDTEGTNLADQKLPHSDHFAGHAATLNESLFDLTEISSSQSGFLTDFGLEDLYSGPATLGTETNEIENVWYEQSNMQHVNSLTFAGDQGMEELYDSAQGADCIH